MARLGDSVNGAMLEMQAAMLARSLYPPEHPRIRASETRAGELLCGILAEREELTVLAVGERVVVEDEQLPGSASLAEGLFLRLRRRGADSITFRRGLEPGEIRRLLDFLADGERAGERLEPSLHVRFGFIHAFDAPAAEQPRVAAAGAVPAPHRMANALADVWMSVGENDSKLDIGTLGDVVTGISRVMTETAGTMLPLASLKKHDEYTFIHTLNVAILSTALSEAIDLSRRVIHEVTLAALLHDVGKRAIPLDVLNKTGKFTDDEFRLVQMHPVEGARMLLATPGAPELAVIVAYEHHIRADLSGYPKVPRGWRLNLASRIVQVADVFDALRSHRPYRPALPLSEIVEIMRKDSGVFFDDDLLELFFERVVPAGLPEPEPVAG